MSTEAQKVRAALTILDATARHGKQCPTLAEIGSLLGVNTDKARAYLDVLRSEKKISWRIQYMGTGIGNVRIVTITETGQTTGLPAYQGRPRGTYKAAKVERQEIDRAKTALRRFGRIVFDAEVTDGPAGKGFVKVDGRNLTPDAVLLLAQATGYL